MRMRRNNWGAYASVLSLMGGGIWVVSGCSDQIGDMGGELDSVGEGVIIGQGLRYAHAAAYVRAAVESAGLKLSLLEDRSARNEDSAPVPGLVAVAAKT